MENSENRVARFEFLKKTIFSTKCCVLGQQWVRMAENVVLTCSKVWLDIISS